MLDIVDDRDRVIGQAPRDQVHREGLLHREVHIWVYNHRGDILFQKRSPTKDTWPNRYDASAGGHVPAGQDYLSAATMELQEETGIRARPEQLKQLQAADRSSTYDPTTKTTNNVFRRIYAYPLTTDADALRIESGKATELNFFSQHNLRHLSPEEQAMFIPIFLGERAHNIFDQIQALATEK